MTGKWESEEGTKFGILHPVLARLTQMGFTVKRHIKAVASKFATIALDATMWCIRECVCFRNSSYTKEFLLLDFRFSSSGLGTEKFSDVPK